MSDPTPRRYDAHAARSSIFRICTRGFLLVNTAFILLGILSQHPVGTWIVNLGVNLPVAALVLLERKRGYSTSLSFIAVLILAALLLVSTFTSGGLVTGEAAWLSMIPLSASLITVGRQPVLWGLFAGVSIGAVWIAHLVGAPIFTVFDDSMILERQAYNALGLTAAATVITWAFTSRFDRALRESHRALAEAEKARDEVERVSDELAKTLERTRTLTDNTQAVFFSFDRDYRIVSFNAPTLDVIRRAGWDEIEEGSDILAAHPDSAPRRKMLYDRALAGESFTVDRVLPGEAGDSTLESSFSPVVVDGLVEYVTVFARDVTEERLFALERERIREHAVQVERLERLGVMAGSFAHDFNNLLTGILCEVELAKDALETDDSEFALESLEAAEAATIRAADTTRTLLTYAGRRPKRTELIDANACARDASTLARSATGRAVEIDLLTPDRPLRIHGDVGQIEQLLLNLIINAVQATLEVHPSDPPPVRVITAQRNLDAVDVSDSWIPALLNAGSHVFIQVIDFGPGLTPEAIDRIFEPFYTTKDDGQGLGLAAASGIARSHGGVLLVDSTPGLGTTFSVAIPVADAPIPVAPETITKTSLTSNTGRVLLIDDNPDAREPIARMLRRVGFDVATAASGPEGLALFDEQAPRISIVDMKMPGMTGAQVLDEIKRRDPCAPVLLVSGYTDDDVEALLLDYPDESVLFCSKPISLDQLYGAIDQLLEARTHP